MRTWRALFGIALLACGGVALAQGCSLITPYDGFTPDGTVITCGARIPAKSGKSAAGDKGVLYGAAKAIRFVGTLGFDLDENCTATPACKTAQPATKRDSGVDNALGQFVAQIESSGSGTSEVFANTGLRLGTYGMLLSVGAWNGTDNDDAIAVNLFNVAGIEGSTDGGPGAQFNGNDSFIPNSDELQVSAVGGSTYQDLTAYVTNGQLVAKFPVLGIHVLVPGATGGTDGSRIVQLVLTEAHLVGVLTASGTGIQLANAQVVGRLKQSDILKTVSDLGACVGSPQFESFKAAVCAQLDLSDSKATDGKGKPCTAGSFAIGYDFVPAKRSQTATTAFLTASICEAGAGPLSCF